MRRLWPLLLAVGAVVALGVDGCTDDDPITYQQEFLGAMTFGSCGTLPDGWGYVDPLHNVKPAGTQQLDAPKLCRNVSIHDGVLDIRAIKESYTHRSNGVTYGYTSGAVETTTTPFDDGEALEVRTKVSTKSGARFHTVAYSDADDGEINFPEPFPNYGRVHWAIHWDYGAGTAGRSVLEMPYTTMESLLGCSRNDWITWRAERTPSVRMLGRCDGQSEWTVMRTVSSAVSANMPDSPHRITVEAQVGGTWGRCPNGACIDPSWSTTTGERLLVDYVRVREIGT